MKSVKKKKFWVCIDGSRPDAFRVGILGKRITETWVTGRSVRVLSVLAQRLPRNAWPFVAGVCVVNGPGSFTSVRTGVLIANMLARVFHVPLVGVSVDEAQDLETLRRSVESGSVCHVSYVAPTYHAPPNITQPRIPVT